MIPKGWNKKTFGDVLNLKNGFAFKSQYFFSEPKTYICVTPGNFYEKGGFKIIPEKIKFYDGDIPDGYILNKGDLIVAMTEQAQGLLGSAAIIPESNKFLHNQRLGLIEQKSTTDINYLYYLFNSKGVRKQITETSTGTKVKHTSRDKIQSVTILIPPVIEQQKIAKILSTWDEAIEKLEKLIEAKKLRKKGLMQQLLTGKKRFDGFDGEWEEKTLGDMGELVRGLTYSPDDVRENGLLVLRSSNVQKSRLTLGDNVYVEKELDDKYYSKSGDILICVRNGSRNLIGKNAIINDECPKATHGAFMSIYRSEFFSYIFQLLQTGFYYKQVHRNLGATINSINNSDLRKFKFNIPPLDEQQAISSFFEVADKEVELLIKRKNKLSYEKKGLMQQLLTGKKRVKID